MQEVPKGGQDGHSRAPATEVPGAEQCSLAKNLERGHASRKLTLHRLRDGEPEIVSHADFEPLPPVGGGVRVPEFGLDPHLPAAHFDWAGRHIIRPEIERAATRKIEPGMVPVAGQNAVLHASAIEGEPHMRASVVERVDATLVTDDQDGSMRTSYDEPPFGVEFRKRALHARIWRSQSRLLSHRRARQDSRMRPRHEPGLRSADTPLRARGVQTANLTAGTVALTWVRGSALARITRHRPGSAALAAWAPRANSLIAAPAINVRSLREADRGSRREADIVDFAGCAAIRRQSAFPARASALFGPKRPPLLGQKTHVNDCANVSMCYLAAKAEACRRQARGFVRHHFGRRRGDDR